MSDNQIFLIAGLGNPGKKYSKNRHNIGFNIIEDLASSHSLSLNKNKFDLNYCRGKIKGSNVILAKPMSYMNNSGVPIQRLSRFLKINHKNIIIIHDDLDIQFGKLKIKEQGGHGGHNGIRSLVSSLGTNEFIRIRVGIGRPVTKKEVSGFVLGNFTSRETDTVNEIIYDSIKATETIISHGIAKCMNDFN